MSATTWGKFYWSDWESDESLKMCSPGAQALWMRMLCVCAKSGGYLTIAGQKLDAEAMATLTGWPLSDVQTWWAELKKWEVFSAEHRGRTFCRRMVRDARKAETARENGRNGGNPTLGNRSRNSVSDNQPPTDPLTKLSGRDHHLPETTSQKEELSEANASSAAPSGAAAPARTKPKTEKPKLSQPPWRSDSDFLAVWAASTSLMRSRSLSREITYGHFKRQSALAGGAAVIRDAHAAYMRSDPDVKRTGGPGLHIWLKDGTWDHWTEAVASPDGSAGLSAWQAKKDEIRRQFEETQ